MKEKQKDEQIAIVVATFIVMLVMAVITLSIVVIKLNKEQHGKDDNTTKTEVCLRHTKEQ